MVRAAFLAGFPTLSILITPGWILRAAGIALGGAILGASYPAWLASRKDPVEALSYDPSNGSPSKGAASKFTASDKQL